MFTISTNARQIEQLFRRIGSDMENKGKELIQDVAKEGLRSAVKATPKDTGTLQRGWQLKPLRKANGEIIGGYGNNVEYMMAVNYGWLAYGKGAFHTGYYMIEKSDAAMRVYSQKRMKKLIKEVIG
ncbi:TPA: HK97 gp10 family phage protein [Bacillus paranthracis]|nr:HK97 gp10 family phage protein [Bacillus paranthracis]HDR7304496.1 HK97 gp10 family phage protein [Bacillus paranthracis]